MLPEGASLTDAARFYSESGAYRSSVSLPDAVAQFIEEKHLAGLRPKSLSLLRYQLRRLSPSAMSPSEVTPSLLVDWLNHNHLTGTTRDSYRRTFKNFFGWCVRMGYCATNPANAITRPIVDATLPGILKPRHVAAMLHHAPAELVPYLALGFFAGIRPAELQRLDWSAITTHIHIGPTVAKTRQQRYVTIERNLRAWLKTYRGTGPVCPMPERRRIVTLAESREAAHVHDWPHDAARHSFASYHLALYQDAGRTAHELGHTSPDTLYRHYRNLVTQESAREYFKIMPK